jgi:hypothetical protein
MKEYSNRSMKTQGASGSRKLQRSLNRVLAMTLTLCLSMTTSAFAPHPVVSVTSRALAGLKQVNVEGDAKEESNIWVPWMTRGRKHGASEGDTKKEANGWVSWITRGRKPGASEIKMREAEELGGVPRTDRYSSRYVE